MPTKPASTQKPTAAPTQKATLAPTEKPTQKETEKATATPTEKAATPKATPKVTSKSGKTLKPSKPATIDCDKDHTVSVQDDHTITGVIKVQSCHASRFQRKDSRCNNVGNTFGSLLTNGLNKAGVTGSYNVNIVKTLGDKDQTEFHYQCPCEKEHQQVAIQQLKEACKDSDLTDTITNENQPDESDSSSESDEDSMEATTVKVTQKETPAPTTVKVTQKEVPQTKATVAPTKQTGELYAPFETMYS